MVITGVRKLAQQLYRHFQFSSTLVKFGMTLHFLVGSLHHDSGNISQSIEQIRTIDNSIKNSLSRFHFDTFTVTTQVTFPQMHRIFL